MKNENHAKAMPRREALKVIGSLPAALAATRVDSVAADHLHTAQAVTKPAYTPKFFTPHEWKTANLLADMIIPKDERSGSASEAGAVDYIDELADFRGETLQTELRGGLKGLDRECNLRFDKDFVDCNEEQRKEILDQIAYPQKAKKDHSQAVAFFNRFRDLTASGFYTSKMGIADLGFMGNRAYEWNGCPDEVLKKLE